MGQKPLSLDEEGQGCSVNSESRCMRRAPRAGTQLEEEETEAGGTRARQEAVGKIQEGVDGEQDEDRERRGERGDTAGGPDSRPERSWQEKGTEEPWGQGPAGRGATGWGGRRARPGRPPPDGASIDVFPGAPRRQQPPGAQGTPPRPAFCLCLASTPKAQWCSTVTPGMLRTSTRNLGPPGGPEDLQSPGEGCGSGEKVYKKPRQDWTEPRRAAASRMPALGARVSTHRVRDHRSPPAVLLATVGDGCGPPHALTPPAQSPRSSREPTFSSPSRADPRLL